MIELTIGGACGTYRAEEFVRGGQRISVPACSQHWRLDGPDVNRSGLGTVTRPDMFCSSGRGMGRGLETMLNSMLCENKTQRPPFRRSGDANQ